MFYKQQRIECMQSYWLLHVRNSLRYDGYYFFANGAELEALYSAYVFSYSITIEWCLMFYFTVILATFLHHSLYAILWSISMANNSFRQEGAIAASRLNVFNENSHNN